MQSIRTYKTASGTLSALTEKSNRAVLFNGDCSLLLKELPNNSVDLVVTSPPYCMGKEYESDNDLQTFTDSHKKILPEIVRITKEGGNICWQVGFYVKDGAIIPLDYLVYDIFRTLPNIQLRNRIVWTFGHGLHCTNRFSGRHEVILWFTKGDKYYFDLDAVRVAQKYPGKRHSKGPKKGKHSGNPKGKNPSDVWDIPNVKANHLEKTKHPCQFPVGLVQRLVCALTRSNGLVFDPFAGVASAGVAALLARRRFLGSEVDGEYVIIAQDRLKKALNGTAKIRPADREIYVPGPNESVAKRPRNFSNSHPISILIPR